MNEFIMLIGIPGSGKSTYATYLNNSNKYIIHSSDKLRAELFGDENIQADNNALFSELHNRIINDLSNGNNVIYDATNINYKKRIYMLERIKNIKCYKKCIVMATPIDMCIYNNKNRDRVVPDEVIYRMRKNFYFPSYFEGWDNISIKYNDIFNNVFDSHYTITGFCSKYKNYNQNNSHHSLTLYAHSLKAYGYVTKNYYTKWYLRFAALLHDCGKPLVATNINKKGELTTDTHYYNHNNVSAYEAMFYLYNECWKFWEIGVHDIDTIVKACSLIQWHMQPYFNHTEKLKNKWKNKFGEEFYNDLLILHNADVYAH